MLHRLRETLSFRRLVRLFDFLIGDRESCDIACTGRRVLTVAFDSVIQFRRGRVLFSAALKMSM